MYQKGPFTRQTPQGAGQPEAAADVASLPSAGELLPPGGADAVAAAIARRCPVLQDGALALWLRPCIASSAPRRPACSWLSPQGSAANQLPTGRALYTSRPIYLAQTRSFEGVTRRSF
jgi:hypothetical protein